MLNSQKYGYLLSLTQKRCQIFSDVQVAKKKSPLKKGKKEKVQEIMGKI